MILERNFGFRTFSSRMKSNEKFIKFDNFYRFQTFRDSGILGTHEKDILTSISPDGTVIISTRIQATLYCAMDLRKFPFDQQQCKTVLESWMYNGSEVKLHWESKS